MPCGSNKTIICTENKCSPSPEKTTALVVQQLLGNAIMNLKREGKKMPTSFFKLDKDNKIKTQMKQNNLCIYNMFFMNIGCKSDDLTVYRLYDSGDKMFTGNEITIKVSELKSTDKYLVIYWGSGLLGKYMKFAISNSPVDCNISNKSLRWWKDGFTQANMKNGKKIKKIQEILDIVKNRKTTWIAFKKLRF